MSRVGPVVSRNSSRAVAARVVVRTAVALLLVVDVKVGCNKNDNKIISLTRKSLVTKPRGAHIRTEWLSCVGK